MLNKLVFPAYRVAPAGSAPSGLDAVVTSAVFDLDATLSASYPGTGQTWSNLIHTPADGSAAADYNFVLGDDNTVNAMDPVFTGTAGTTGAYFLLDGDTYFTKAAVNTAFLNTISRSDGGGSPWWFAVAYRQKNATTNAAFFSTAKTSVTNTGSGLALYLNSSEQPVLNQANGSTTTTTAGNFVSAALDGYAAHTVDTDYLFIVSVDPQATNKLRAWKNGTAYESSTYAYNTLTSNVSGTMSLFAATTGASGHPDGTRVYSVAMGNEFLDDTRAAAILAHMNTRHGRTYG